MATITKTFEDAGVSAELLIRAHESFTYAADYSADFDGGLFLEYSDDGGITWKVVRDFGVGFKTDVTTTQVNDAAPGNYRFRCILDPEADPLVLTGDVAVTITDVSEVVQSFEDGTGAPMLNIVEGGVTLPGTLSVTGAVGLTGNVTLTNTAPTIELADSTTNAKDLTVKVDGNKAQLRETAGADGTLLVLDLANNRVGVATASPTVALDVTGAAKISSTLEVTGAITATGGVVRTGVKRTVVSGAKVGATAGWVVGAANNIGRMATLPASQTGSTLVVPLTGLKVGDTLTSVHLVGQIESAGNTVTVDMGVWRLTAAAADLTNFGPDTMTQLSVTADTIMSAANTTKNLTTPDVVAADETFYVVITATTLASTDIDLMGVAYTVTEG